MDRPSLVVLSTNFGTNFSGGSSVTCEILTRIQDQFDQIVFVGSRVGEHKIRNFTFIQTRNWLKTYLILRRLQKKHHIFYGDFYDSFLLAAAKTRYVFSYHDNWPELSELSFFHRIQNIFYKNIYTYIFNHAMRLTTVSNYKKHIIRDLTDTPVEVIPNGFSNKEESHGITDATGKAEILMVGNIDQRKYRLAIDLFKGFNQHIDVEIDIYGHFTDRGLVEQLQKFSFVNLKGFRDYIPYSSYKFLLHTSFIESFGMVFLEAIAHGIPVITFERGGASEIIHRDNGVLIPPYELEKMKQAILQLLKSPMTVDPKSIEAYTWEKVASAYRKIFNEVFNDDVVI